MRRCRRELAMPFNGLVHETRRLIHNGRETLSLAMLATSNGREL